MTNGSAMRRKVCARGAGRRPVAAPGPAPCCSAAPDTRDTAPVFLEVIPDGDWRWAELKSRSMVVTLAAARMLADLHHEARRALPPALGGGVRPLDINPRRT